VGPGPVDDLGPGLKPRRRGDPHVQTQPRPRQKQGMAHVVAVPHVGQPEPLQTALLLPQRQEVRQSLTGVQVVAEAVDDGNSRMPGQRHDVFVSKDPGDDPVDVPAQHASRVGDRLSTAQLEVLGVPVQGMPPHLKHGDLEGHTGPGRRLLKDHPQDPAVQLVGIPFRRLLDFPGELKKPAQGLDGYVVRVQKVSHGHRPGPIWKRRSDE